jgi:hypothetical protein
VLVTAPRRHELSLLLQISRNFGELPERSFQIFYDLP